MKLIDRNRLFPRRGNIAARGIRNRLVPQHYFSGLPSWNFVTFVVNFNCTRQRRTRRDGVRIGLPAASPHPDSAPHSTPRCKSDSMRRRPADSADFSGSVKVRECIGQIAGDQVVRRIRRSTRKDSSLLNLSIATNREDRRNTAQLHESWSICGTESAIQPRTCLRSIGMPAL